MEGFFSGKKRLVERGPFRIGCDANKNCFKYFPMYLQKEHFSPCKFPFNVGYYELLKLRFCTCTHIRVDILTNHG